MWTTLSVKICLLTLAVVMLSSATQGTLADIIVPCECNGHFFSKVIQRFKSCYEQIPRDNCVHAFKFFQGKHLRCIKPDAAWLMEKIEKGNLTCPPDLTLEK